MGGLAMNRYVQVVFVTIEHTRMSKRRGQRFTRLDAMILVVAAAIGLALARHALDYLLHPPSPTVSTLPASSIAPSPLPHIRDAVRATTRGSTTMYPLILAFTFAGLILRFTHPRTRDHAHRDQQGRDAERSDRVRLPAPGVGRALVEENRPQAKVHDSSPMQVRPLGEPDGSRLPSTTTVRERMLEGSGRFRGVERCSPRLQAPTWTA